ncbi:MAG: 4Fe-4S dicluster domain-containing protein [Muribaculaceae bacterium]|nr:4Fe-4S dicluster domain-containing protein [Muribaculaceae bacterium]
MKSSKFLRISRITVAILVTVLLTGVLTSYSMTLPKMAGVLVRIQFLPAALAFALSTIVIWLIATIIFGRIYCSTVCPLGTFQDVMARLPRLAHHNHKREYHYSAPHTGWRNITLAVFVVSVFLGVSLVATLLDPYSIYSRFCVLVAKPLWGLTLNMFNSTPIRMAAASGTGIVTALIMMGIIGWIAARHGRTYCNTICPVGTSLGFISRYSIFRIDINTDKCIECRKCEHVCKASCINMNTHVIDSSRCVVCFDCLPVCPNDAIHYTTNRHQLSIPLMRKVSSPLAGSAAGFSSEGESMAHSSSEKMLLDRRAFLTTGAILAVSPLMAAAAKKRRHLEGGLLNGQESLAPSVAVTPPGVYERKDFLDRCTGCGLCISHCMTKVLRPAIGEYGLLRVFHPVKDYNRSYCAYTCTRCTNLCPTGALTPLTKEEKKRNAVGLAMVSIDRCISCGKCAESCRAEAITLVEFENRGGRLFPVVNASKCIGCGSCQYVCPAVPYKAIIVNGFQ